MSKQFVEASYNILYASNIQASIKWYFKLFGYRVLDAAPDYAVLETSPGQILYLSTNEDAARNYCIICTDIEPARQHLVEHDITFEEDLPHWLVFRDPDQNEIGIWLINPIDVQFTIPEWFREPMRDIIRFHLESKEDSHLIVKSIEDQSETIAVTTALITECKANGLLPQGEPIRISKFSNQVDAFYVGVPIAKAPARNLPDGLEYIVIPKQEYTVYPIHKSKLETSRTIELANRVQHSKKGLSRPDQFYILEHSVDDDYIEAYIPYVWNDVESHVQPDGMGRVSAV